MDRGIVRYLKYIFWVLLVIVPCVVTILIYNDKITQNSPVYYKQGVRFYNEGNYADAFYNFSKIKRLSPLYPMALFKQAKSAQKIGDYKTAVLKYNLFLKKMPESVFNYKAHLNLAKSYYYLKQYEEAKSEFEKLLKTEKSTDEEVFYLGLIEKNYNKEKSADYFRTYLESIEKKIYKNKTYILAAAQELSSLGVKLTSDDLQLIGKAFFKEHKYNDALNFLSKLPFGMCWDYFVLSNHYSGNKSVAKKLIESGIIEYSNNADEDNLKEIYNIYVSNLNGTKFKNWMQTMKFVEENNLKYNDYVLYKIAQMQTREKSINYYKHIYENYPNSKYAPESLWNIIWNEYKKGNYLETENLALLHLKTYKNVKSTPKVIFWLGKTYLKQNRNSYAFSEFNRLMIKYPDNYYGLRAAFITGKRNDFWNSEKEEMMPLQEQEIDFPISTSNIDLKDLKIINTLFEMGDYEIWLDADFTNPIVESWFEFKKGKKSRSIVLARDEISKMDVKAPIMSAVYKLAYPVYMGEEINMSGKKYGIDPFLIISIIREESYFNENAKSRTGAAGLMQLMPSTAKYMLSKLNMEDTIDIEDARINLYLGCNYLKYLKNRFDNNLYITAAYNGGEGITDKWIKNFKGEDLDEFIEDIPYDETRHYVKKVFRTYQMYKKIYK